MRVLLIIIAACSLLASLGTCAVAKGAPHEIEAQLWFLIFIVSGTGAAILDVLGDAVKVLRASAALSPPPKKEE